MRGTFYWYVTHSAFNNYRSVPTVTTQALSGTFANGSLIEFSKFRVAASDAGKIDLNKVTIGLTWSTSTSDSLSVGSFKFYRGPISSSIASVSPSVVTPGVDSIAVIFTNSKEIGAGEYFNYTLKGVATGFGKTTTGVPDVLSLQVLGDAAPIDSATSGAPLIAAKNFVWSDESSLGHSLSTADWTGGYLVNSLPLDTQSRSW